MKKLCMLTVLFLALTCAIVCCSAGVTPLTFFAALRSSALAAAAPQDATRTSDSPSSAAPSMQTQTRGDWVATAYSIDYPAQPTTDADTLRAAKRFTRMALKPYLGGKPLKSRELFRQFMPKRTVKTHYE